NTEKGCARPSLSARFSADGATFVGGAVAAPNSEEQTEFIKIFSDLLEQTYVNKIESCNNEKFIYTNERIGGPYAEVNSKMRNSKGEEFSINYKLHRAGGDWRVYDLVIENVSLVNNYRSQFNRILSSSTYDELVMKLKRKLSDNRDGLNCQKSWPVEPNLGWLVRSIHLIAARA